MSVPSEDIAAKGSAVFAPVAGAGRVGLLADPIRRRVALAAVVLIALFSILNSGAGYLFDHTIKEFPTPFGNKPFLGVTVIGTHQAGMIGVTLVMLGLLYLFFRGTRLGLAMRAAAANPESARLVGIRVGWMTT